MNHVREKRGSVERELAGCWDLDPAWAGLVGPGTQASETSSGGGPAPRPPTFSGGGPSLSSASPAYWHYASGLTHLEKKLQRPPESRALAACPGPAAGSPTSACLPDLSSFSPIT